MSSDQESPSPSADLEVPDRATSAAAAWLSAQATEFDTPTFWLVSGLLARYAKAAIQDAIHILEGKWSVSLSSSACWRGRSGRQSGLVTGGIKLGGVMNKLTQSEIDRQNAALQGTDNPPRPFQPDVCPHIHQSGHPAEQDIRMCHDCDARSVDGGTTWMTFEEYERDHCKPNAALSKLFEAAPLPNTPKAKSQLAGFHGWTNPDRFIQEIEILLEEKTRLEKVNKNLLDQCSTLGLRCYPASTSLRNERAEKAEQGLTDWKRQFEMYRTAWLREIGGVIVRKTHEIDGFVLRTQQIYQQAQKWIAYENGQLLRDPFWMVPDLGVALHHESKSKGA